MFCCDIMGYIGPGDNCNILQYNNCDILRYNGPSNSCDILQGDEVYG